MGYYFAPLHYTSGEIIIDGQNISGMDPDNIRKSILGTGDCLYPPGRDERAQPHPEDHQLY